jgi:hypothetical protein
MPNQGEHWAMMKIVMICGLAGIVVGCLGNSANTRTLRPSGETGVLAESYHSQAVRLVEERNADPGFARVSNPQQLPRSSGFMPGEWYVCLRGIPEHQAGILTTLARLFRSWITPTDTQDVYEIVLFFPQTSQILISEGYDLPLCRNLDFELIVAESASMVEDAETIRLDTLP